MILSTLNLLLAAVIFIAVAWRMLVHDRPHPSLACCTRWALWTGWHVMVGVGAFAILTGPLYGAQSPGRAEVLVNAGLALYFIVRWRRRGDDKRGGAR